MGNVKQIFVVFVFNLSIVFLFLLRLFSPTARKPGQRFCLFWTWGGVGWDDRVPCACTHDRSPARSVCCVRKMKVRTCVQDQPEQWMA